MKEWNAVDDVPEPWNAAQQLVEGGSGRQESVQQPALPNCCNCNGFVEGRNEGL